MPSLQSIVVADSEAKSPVPGCWQFEDLLLDLSSQGPGEHLVNASDPVNIQFTSGTTGSPKGAVLSHRNILNNAQFVAQRMDFSPSDILCLPVPLHHCFGVVMGFLASLTTGSQVVLPSPLFNAEKTLEAVQHHRATALHGVPTMFIEELSLPNFSEYDVSGLRTGIMAGSICPEELLLQIHKEMGMQQITVCYGMTETSPVSFQTAAKDLNHFRYNTVGTILPHVEAKIVDERGFIVPSGKPGEMFVRGYSVMNGYWNDSVKTKESIDDDGWMRTGDLATLDSEGYCRIVGRIKDIIIRGKDAGTA